MSIRRSCNAAQTIIQELVEFGFKIELVLADSLDGESHPFVELLDQLNLPWVVAIRSNHGVWMPENEEPECTDWQCFERVFSNGKIERSATSKKQSLVGAYGGATGR